jgi:hypothetical protein
MMVLFNIEPKTLMDNQANIFYSLSLYQILENVRP